MKLSKMSARTGRVDAVFSTGRRHRLNRDGLAAKKNGTRRDTGCRGIHEV